MTEKIEVDWIDGSKCSATLVEIEESVERWVTLNLSDGAVLKVKPIITEVSRVIGKNDSNNNPVYSLKHQIVATVAKAPKN